MVEGNAEGSTNVSTHSPYHNCRLNLSFSSQGSKLSWLNLNFVISSIFSNYFISPSDVISRCISSYHHPHPMRLSPPSNSVTRRKCIWMLVWAYLLVGWLVGFIYRRINPFRVIERRIKFQTIQFSMSIVFCLDTIKSQNSPVKSQNSFISNNSV